ncbi:septum formation initiator family protein [Patescibacteria group bacterium]|jgi:cell division protein FtsB|nr:septum formation initiator family protein [Patescibacteria group bacterium]
MRPSSSPSHSPWTRILRWPVFLVANVALFLLVGVSTMRETYRGWTVEREIHALEAQAQELEGRKLKLVELASDLTSPERVELDARRDLGWKKPGEQVVVLAGYDASSTWKGAPSTLAALPAEPVLSNPERWFQYFFHR